MKNLVIGSNGLLGSELVNFLLQKEEEVIIIDERITKNSHHDLLLAMEKSDFVFFLAASTAGDGTKFMNEKEKSFDFLFNNLDLMNEVFEALKKSKKPFIFTSNHIVNDINSVHANIKKIGERFTESLGGISIRLWNLYGLQSDPGKYNAISSFIEQGLRGKSIQCQTDGKEKRQFLYTKDCCEALYLISKLYDNIKKTHKESYIDVTSFQWNTVEDVLEIIAPKLGASWSFTNKCAKERNFHEPNKILLNHWKPKYSLEEGIEELIERYKKALREPAIRNIPKEMYDDFTMGRRVPVIDYYFDDTIGHDYFEEYKKENIEKMVSLVRQDKTLNYHDTEKLLYRALKKYPIEGKKVLIIGSEKPHYEAIVLAHKGFPYVVEYKKIKTNHPLITYMTVEEYNKIENPEVYDCAFSISSFEHDGLGRYGDPIDPWGDIKSMGKLKKMIKKNGLLFLAVPIGSDKLYWNAMRCYGVLRFPMLTNEWKMVEAFGFSKLDLFKEYSSRWNPIAKQTRWDYFQPVFVLENI